MLLTTRLVSIAYDYQDGNPAGQPRTEYGQRNMLRALPSALEYMARLP